MYITLKSQNYQDKNNILLNFRQYKGFMPRREGKTDVFFKLKYMFQVKVASEPTLLLDEIELFR